MTDEKILKDEILDDEQLEQVAGGKESQTERTIDGLKKLGVISQFSDPHDEDLVKRALSAYGFNAQVYGGHVKNNRYVCRSGEFAGIDVGVDGALKIIEELQRRGEFHYVD